MKNKGIFLLAVISATAFLVTGCGKKDAGFDESAFQDDVEPMTDEEIKAMDQDSTDEEMTATDEKALNAAQNEENSDKTEQNVGVVEDAVYTDQDKVAQYIYAFGHLPSNYMTESEALELGWDSEKDNLEEVAAGKCIGGDPFDNSENMLPVEDGVTYKQCDVDCENGKRSDKKLVYTSDGKRIYYTTDNGKTFQEIY